MKKSLLSSLALAAVGSLFFVGSASADLYNTRPFNGVNPPPVGEPSLQGLLDTVTNNAGLNAIDDQSSTAVWTDTDASSAAYLVSTNTSLHTDFGVYSFTTGVEVDLTFDPNFGAEFFIDDLGSLVTDTGTWNNFGNSFGFYIRGPGATYYTEDSKNGGETRALAYQLNSGVSVSLSLNRTATTNGNDDWLLAFEDGDDSDFQDRLFFIEDIVTAVPEPATLLLFGTGLLGLAGFGRRKAKK